MASSKGNISEKSHQSADLEERKTTVTGKLDKREKERLESIQKKKEEKDTVSASGENTNFFFENFQKLKNSISEAITQSPTLPKTDLPDHFSSLGKQLDQLNKFITDSTIYLPSYDVQKSQATVVELQAELQKMKDTCLPKKKFAFKSRTKTTDKPSDMVDHAEKEPAVNAKKYNFQIDECNISNLTATEVMKNRDEIAGKDIILSNLTGCTIKLHGVASVLHGDKLTNCRIFCGPMPRSIFLDNCINCTFVLACQQLRIHHTSKSFFYIHVTTKAIIEDTKEVKFGKYCFDYDGIEQDWAESGLDQNRNNWDDIDDFNFLASDCKSPNWSLVGEEEAKPITG